MINTELDAVNEILASIGEAPINTLEEVDNVDVMNALRILDKVSRQVQERSWTFNTINDYTLHPDERMHTIKWSDYFLRILAHDGTVYRNRDGLVYDILQNTDIFISPLQVKATFFLPFADIPSVFRDYITARAARLFSASYLGDPQVVQNLVQEEQVAYQHIMEYEVQVERPSMRNSSMLQQMTNRGY